MDLRDNVRINRTKMLDEAAINHRPAHFINTFCIFLIVFFIVNLAREVLVTIPTAFYLITDDRFWEAMGQYIAGEIDKSQFTLVLDELGQNMPWYVILVSVLSSGFMILGAIIYCTKFEKRTIASLGLRKKNTNIVLEYGIGVVIGVAMFYFTLLIANAIGAITVEFNPNMSWTIILFLIAFIIQGAGEEIFLRGYLMTSVARDYKISLALIFSSAVFSLIHASNAGVSLLAFANIFLFGVFEGIYVLKRGNIWGACAIHSMWNFVQGNIYGSSVSGMSSMPSIFICTPNPTMDSASGGAFGIEGGFATTIIVLVAIGILLLVPPKKSELPDYELNRNTFNDQDNFNGYHDYSNFSDYN